MQGNAVAGQRAEIPASELLSGYVHREHARGFELCMSQSLHFLNPQLLLHAKALPMQQGWLHKSAVHGGAHAGEVSPAGGGLPPALVPGAGAPAFAGAAGAPGGGGLPCAPGGGLPAALIPGAGAPALLGATGAPVRRREFFNAHAFYSSLTQQQQRKLVSLF